MRSAMSCTYLILFLSSFYFFLFFLFFTFYLALNMDWSWCIIAVVAVPPGAKPLLRDLDTPSSSYAMISVPHFCPTLVSPCSPPIVECWFGLGLSAIHWGYQGERRRKKKEKQWRGFQTSQANKNAPTVFYSATHHGGEGLQSRVRLSGISPLYQYDRRLHFTPTRPLSLTPETEPAGILGALRGKHHHLVQ